MKIKIRGGSNAADLCKTCCLSHIFETDTQDVTRLCRRYDARAIALPEKVVKCDCYDEEKQVSVYDLRDIAWVLRTDKAGKHIGFTPYKDLPRSEKKEIDNLD